MDVEDILRFHFHFITDEAFADPEVRASCERIMFEVLEAEAESREKTRYDPSRIEPATGLIEI